METFRVLDVEVFPARAGMIPDMWRHCLVAAGIPRESGDDPMCAMLAMT